MSAVSTHPYRSLHGDAAPASFASACPKPFALQRDDRELEVWVSETRLRASMRIGELVRELDVKPGARTDLQPRPNAGTKSGAIADAGLSKSEAYRYQELAGKRDERAY